MKIDSEIRAALERAIEANSNRYQFSLKVGIPQQTIGRWLSGRTASITDDAWNRVHPYLKPYMGTVAAPQVPPAAPPTTPDTIRNTPELRECIKDAMLREGVASAADLNRLIGYDSVHTPERLLSGKLNWFPDILSAVAEALGIDHDSLPISPAERMQLLPAGYFGDGAMLVRPIPVVSWANAAGHLDLLALKIPKPSRRPSAPGKGLRLSASPASPWSRPSWTTISSWWNSACRSMKFRTTRSWSPA